MHRPRPLVIALAAAGVTGGVLFAGGAAQATAFCDIPSMPDGFLALRDQPSAKGKLVARMKEGDEVMLNTTVADRNGWTRVYWWKGETLQRRRQLQGDRQSQRPGLGQRQAPGRRMRLKRPASHNNP